MIMKARNGYTFKRIHDGLIMGDELILGFDYSTGVKRIDLPEYYEEIYIAEPWHEDTNFQIKLTLIDNTKMLQKYPDMAQYAKVLPCYIELDYVYLYVNFITDEDITRLNEFNAIINEHN